MSQPGTAHKSGYLLTRLLGVGILALLAVVGCQTSQAALTQPSGVIVSGKIQVDNQLNAQIHQLEIADDGTIWAVSNDDIFRFDSTTEQWISFSLTQSDIQVDEGTQIVIETDGTLWLLTDNQLSSYDGLDWHTCAMPASILDRVDKRLYLSPQDEIWLSHYGVNPDGYDLMLSRFDGQKWYHITPNASQHKFPTPNNVFHLYLNGVDADNIPWVSYGYPTGPVTYYLEGEDLVRSPDSIYRAIFEADGSRWTMLPGSRLYAARTTQRTYGLVGICYQLAGETQRCYLTASPYDQDCHSPWESDCEQRVIQVNANVSGNTEFSESQALFGHRIADFAVAPDHTIWVLSIADYNYMDDPTLHPDPPEEWLSLTHIDGENWKTYDLAHQQVSTYDLSTIWNIEIAPDGSVWVVMDDMVGKLKLSELR